MSVDMTDEQFALLELTVKFVKENERLHDQSTWMANTNYDDVDQQHDSICSTKDTPQAVVESLEANGCGTPGCIAGWGALIAGWCQVRDGACFGHGNGLWFYERPTDEVVNPGTGETQSMMATAMSEFGLTYQQAGDLFAARNTLDDIEEMVNALREDRDANLSAYRRGMRAECREFGSQAWSEFSF